MVDTLETIYITSADTPKPEVNPNYLRMYGHHNCPFVEKARLAFAARNVQYQRVELDLEKKTQWHKDINGGLVPILEFPNGVTLIESKVLMDYAEEAFPDQGYSTLPADPVVRAKMRIAFPLSDQLMGAFYPIVMKKSYDEEQFKKLRDTLQKVEDFLVANGKEGSPFALGTENPTQLDIHVYVVLSRIEMFRGSVWNDAFWANVNWESYPRINALVEAIRARPEFQGALTQRVTHQEWYERQASTEPGHKVQLFVPYKI
jgi:glutathione S-transferase